jgi:uncharacterized protein
MRLVLRFFVTIWAMLFFTFAALPNQNSGAFRISPSVSDGILNMRDGPGQRHKLITSIPAGTSGVRRIGACIEADDGGLSKNKWCNVEWRGHAGWVSMGGLQAIRAPTFDCSRATNSSEMAICGDPTLARQDQHLSDLYRRLLEASGDSIKPAQRAWLAKRSDCGSDTSCLKNIYTERINRLNEALNATSGPKTSARTERPVSAVMDECLRFKAEKDFAKEIICLSQIIARNPAMADAYLQRGEAYFATNEYVKADADYKKVTELLNVK